jgi:methyl-accepting chemotaxis protein
MLSWFKKHAPIRVKFKVIVGVNLVVALANLWVAYMAGNTHPTEASQFVLIAGGLTMLPVLIAWYSGRVISDPYVATVVRMEGLAAGDLHSEIGFTDHRDCVGRMTRAMAVFRKNAEDIGQAGAAAQTVVTGLGEGLNRLANSDLTYRIEDRFAADYEKLRTDFNAAMESVSAAMRTVTETAGGINSGASDIRQASDDLSHRTEQQAASLEETAAAMDEITSTVRHTAEGANRANKIVGVTRAEAEESGAIVARAVEAMGGIERTSSEISEIISVIDGIAFQTNLLALNAGVEAARAGDAGRGFAVVASEVRALAQRSADAAKDVKSRIMASSEQVEAGVELVSETGKALQRIIGRIAEISTLVSDIAASADQQATGLQQVNTAVSEMDNVTQQNAAMVEQATAAARSLAVEADALANEVARFKLDDGGTSHRRPAPQPSAAIHQLQDRAARAGREMARSARTSRAPSRGNAAVAVNQDDWSEF